MAGRLFICATPIGNLGDMSPRAVEVLGGADVVLAEDTRVTRKLFTHFSIPTPLERFDEPTSERRIPEVIARLEAGQRVALVSDAGTPLISDPGYRLVAAAQDAGIDVECVPGPSAVTAALSVSGLPTNAFYFGGFLPRKRGEVAAVLGSLATLEATLVFFESPHRIVASLRSLAESFPHREGAVIRELSKLHEEVVRLPLPALVEEFATRDSIKGEIVVIVGPPAGAEKVVADEAQIERELAQRLAGGESPSRAAREVAAELGVPKGAVYDLAVKMFGASKGPMS